MQLLKPRFMPVVVMALALAVQLLRLMSTWEGDPFDRVFSEDGTVFLADAQRLGWHSVGYSFAGYGHLLPRFLGLGGTLVPLADYAAYAAVSAALVVGAFVGLAFVAARRVVGPVLGLLGTLVIVLVPALNDESLGVIANLQWFLLPVAAWFLVDDGQSSPGLTRAVVLATALTAPLTVLLTPLLAVRGRSWYRHPAVPMLAGGFVVQGVYVLFAPSSGAGPARDLVVYPAIMVTHAAELSVNASLDPRIVVPLAAFLTLLSVLTVVRASSRRVPLLVLLSAVLMGTVPTVLSGVATGRYTGVALTLLLMAAVVGSRERPTSRLVMLNGVTFVIAATLGFGVTAHRTDGTSWVTHVRDAQPSCEATGRASIPVAPEPFFPAAQLRC